MIALWTVAVVVGLVLLPVVLLLLHRTLRPLLEADRYAEAILDAGLGIAANLDGLDEAVRTSELAPAVDEIARIATTDAGRTR